MSTKTVLNALITKLKGTQKRTLPMVFGAPAQLRELFGKALRDPQLTADGMGVEYKVGDHIVIGINPADDTLVVRSSANFIDKLTLEMEDGVLDDMDQVMIMGQAARILAAHKAAKDPVKQTLDLSVVMPAAPSPAKPAPKVTATPATA